VGLAAVYDGIVDLKDKVVTGDAVFCRKSICVLAVSKGGEDVFPVTGNQPSLEADIETAFTLPVLPVESHDSGYEKGHGRIERRTIDVLPAEAVGPVAMDWPKLARSAASPSAASPSAASPSAASASAARSSTSRRSLSPA
jgi:predicted transposase YbfD/YdcC